MFNIVHIIKQTTGTWSKLLEKKQIMMETRGGDKNEFDEQLRDYYQLIEDCEKTGKLEARRFGQKVVLNSRPCVMLWKICHLGLLPMGNKIEFAIVCGDSPQWLKKVSVLPRILHRVWLGTSKEVAHLAKLLLGWFSKGGFLAAGSWLRLYTPQA